MQSSQLNRILRLVRRTGDRFVIMDKETDDVVVLMDLNEYEDLLNDAADIEELEEEDMLNRVSHDIAQWRDKKDVKDDWICDEEEEVTEATEPSEITEPAEIDFTTPDADVSEEPIIKKEDPILEEKLVPLNQETGMVDNTIESEDLTDVPHTDLTEDDEPRFLLEPIE